MPIWFRYSFFCPTCGVMIQSGEQWIAVNSREEIPGEVTKRYPNCPRCGKPIPEGTGMSITESYSTRL
jgi:ribosomal protein S27AE